MSSLNNLKKMLCVTTVDSQNNYIVNQCTKLDIIIIGLGFVSLLISSLSIMASRPDKDTKTNKRLDRNLYEKFYYFMGIAYTVLAYFCFVYLLLPFTVSRMPFYCFILL